jgi:hypothetical protein
MSALDMYDGVDRDHGGIVRCSDLKVENLKQYLEVLTVPPSQRRDSLVLFLVRLWIWYLMCERSLSFYIFETCGACRASE